VQANAHDELNQPPLKNNPLQVFDKAEKKDLDHPGHTASGFGMYLVRPNSLDMSGDGSSDGQFIIHAGGGANGTWKDALRVDNPERLFVGPLAPKVVFEYAVEGRIDYEGDAQASAQWRLRVGSEMDEGRTDDTDFSSAKLFFPVKDSELIRLTRPEALEFSIFLSANSVVQDDGTAYADFHGRLQGIYVRDQAGNPIHGVRFSSASGYVYPVNPPGGDFGPLSVDPLAPNLPPITLPSFIGAPPTGTVQVPTPPDGGPPDNRTPNDGLSMFTQTSSVNAIIGFTQAHPAYQLEVQPEEGDDSYAVTVSVRDGDDFASYGVNETASLIAVSYADRDGSLGELIVSSETPETLDGGRVQAKFDNGLVTALSVVTQIGGAASIWYYPGGASPQPALTSDAGVQALFDLIDMHLDGPAKPATLAAYQTTLAGYMALATSQPGGDFDGSGTVDSEDLASWRLAFGDGAASDADHDGDSDGNDFLAWQRDLGANVTPAAAVPEPAAALMNALALLAIAAWPRARRHRP
jgi:hypothetical protein